MSQMKFCRYCGGEVSETANACGHCGRWLAAEPTTPAAGEAPAEQTEPKPIVPPDEPTSSKPEELEPAPLAAPPKPRQVVGAPAPTEGVKPVPPAPSPTEAPASPGQPKSRIPVWAWGLGVVAIIVIVGAALAMTGAIALPNRQGGAPQVIASPAAASRPTRAPASVPAPRVEPVTVLLGTEGAAKTVEPDQQVIVEWVWGVCDPALLEENIAAVHFRLTLDGRVLATGDMAGYQTEVREQELGGLHAWWQYYAYPLGGFTSGSSHSFELERGFSRQVTDGCDLDGDGKPDYYGPDSSTTSTLHLTVR